MTRSQEGKKRKCNKLLGKEWLKNSISIWSNIRKTSDENFKNHPASFPKALVRKLLNCFTNDDDRVVLDPFMGIGTTIMEAVAEGKEGIGFEIYDSFIETTKERLKQPGLFDRNNANYKLISDNVNNIGNYLDEDSVDIVITSPPYWNILNQKRTADGKNTKNYGDNEEDLGLINDYSEFLQELSNVFCKISSILRKDKYCIINVMDIRKGPKLYTVHSDLPIFLANYGYELDDIIIWDRSHEYNNLRPLGYPYVFRLNRIHEYILIFINRRNND